MAMRIQADRKLKNELQNPENFKISIWEVVAVDVIPPRIVEFKNDDRTTFWRDGKVVFHCKDGEDVEKVEIDFTTDHFLHEEDVPEIEIRCTDTSIAMADELEDLRHRLAVAAEVLDVKADNE